MLIEPYFITKNSTNISVQCESQEWRSEHKHNDLTMMNLSFDFFNMIWTSQNGFWQQYGLGLAYICTLSVTYPKLGGLIENINSWKAIGKKFSSLIPPPSTYTSSAPKWMLARSRRESEVGFCVNHYAKIRKEKSCLTWVVPCVCISFLPFIEVTPSPQT